MKDLLFIFVLWILGYCCGGVGMIHVYIPFVRLLPIHICVYRVCLVLFSLFFSFLFSFFGSCIRDRVWDMLAWTEYDMM